jgi:hypothetical protein
MRLFLAVTNGADVGAAILCYGTPRAQIGTALRRNRGRAAFYSLRSRATEEILADTR